uniref:Uncharacterized protein n=1 Tax=Arundo donax TaxID=35708 RepID=A0A0A9GX63_ARUDO
MFTSYSIDKSNSSGERESYNPRLNRIIHGERETLSATNTVAKTYTTIFENSVHLPQPHDRRAAKSRAQKKS